MVARMVVSTPARAGTAGVSGTGAESDWAGIKLGKARPTARVSSVLMAEI